MTLRMTLRTGRHVLLALAFFAFPAPGSFAEDVSGPDAWLDRLGRVAGLYHDTALKFASDEEITGTGLPTPCRFEYIYVYSASQGLRDYRTLPGRQREVDPGACRIPQFLRRAYSWVFVFAADARKHHRYAIAGEDEALGRAAIKISFEPIPPFRRGVNEWFGTAWVDRETSQILKVEALQHEEHRKQEEIEKDLASPAGGARLHGKHRAIERVTTEFSVEKNGMRFPGRALILRTDFKIPGEAAPFDESTVYRIEQNYTHYRFYGVRTKEEIRAIVQGK
ncbi:MAG TPA: hypothetical protein VFQ07_05010 [Candidatus Polarisedimenticolia bacterium]|nr:hypothetical protein [Candidatus Polarisedimenticolia bacterium]